MSDVLAYVRQRMRSKGVLNVLSALSRTYLGGFGTDALARAAGARHRRWGGAPDLHVVAIETMSGCNYRCSFCPIGTMPLPSGRMELPHYERILSQLTTFEGEIHLFFMNEPLLDKRLPEMARMAAERTRASVVIQTNGSVLTAELASSLVPHAVLIVNDYTRDRSVAARARSFALAARRLIIVERNPDATLTNRAGNVPGPPVAKLRNFCVRPFKELYIAHNGKAVLCCQDWGFEAVVGDTHQQSVEEIWNGPELMRVRASLMRGERVGLCAKCDFVGV